MDEGYLFNKHRVREAAVRHAAVLLQGEEHLTVHQFRQWVDAIQQILESSPSKQRRAVV